MKTSESYTYINNKRQANLLMIHGLGCSGVYYNSLIAELGEMYNYLVVDLPGHGANHRITDISWEEVQADILHIIEELNISIPVIIAHSMGSLVAFELHPVLNPDMIILLSGNLIKQDFEWSASIAKMNRDIFDPYWIKFQRSYKTYLRINLINKHVDFDFFSRDIMRTDAKIIHQWGKILATKKSSINDYAPAFSNTFNIESEEYEYYTDKKRFCDDTGIGLISLQDVSHFPHLDNAKEISRIIIDIYKEKSHVC